MIMGSLQFYSNVLLTFEGTFFVIVKIMFMEYLEDGDGRIGDLIHGNLFDCCVCFNNVVLTFEANSFNLLT